MAVVAYVVKHDDYIVSFEETMFDTPVCASRIDADQSRYELVVVRVPLGTGPATELLRADVDPLGWFNFFGTERAAIVDVHASGNDVAIALRGTDASGPKIRALRLTAN